MSKTRLHHLLDTAKIKERYGLSRPRLYEHIQNYGVTIENKLVTDRQTWVLTGQQIDIEHWPEKKLANYEGVRVVAEEKDWLVVFKPSGLVTHPGTANAGGTLLDWLLATFPEQQLLRDQAPSDSNAVNTAGLVHRLDKDTAGLLLVAKNLSQHAYLQDKFRNRKIIKKYWAILEGQLTAATEVVGWQSRDKKKPRLQKFFEQHSKAIEYNELARTSHSTFVPLEYSSKYNQTKVEIIIHTGRMHQIRIHAKFLKHAVVNDLLYGKKTTDQVEPWLSSYTTNTQLQLVSHYLEWDHHLIEL